jgi:hypothetical protein
MNFFELQYLEEFLRGQDTWLSTLVNEPENFIVKSDCSIKIDDNIMTYKEGEITFTGLNDDTKIRCTAEGEIYVQDELQNVTDAKEWTMKLNERDYLFVRKIFPIVNSIAVVVQVYNRNLRFENCTIMISKDGKNLASKVHNKLYIGKTEVMPRMIIEKDKVSWSINTTIISFDVNTYVITYESSEAQLTFTPNGDTSIVTGSVLKNNVFDMRNAGKIRVNVELICKYSVRELIGNLNLIINYIYVITAKKYNL